MNYLRRTIMRDIKRIEKFLKIIQVYWEKYVIISKTNNAM